MNLLILTAHFPHFDQPGLTYATPFLAKYAAEWAKAGHRVTVLHCERKFPALFRLAAKLVGKLGIHRFDKYLVDPSAYREAEFEYEGFMVSRVFYKKYVPHSATPVRRLKGCRRRLQTLLLSIGKPDLVLGDCLDPVLSLAHAAGLDGQDCYAQIVHTADFAYLDRRPLRDLCPEVRDWLIRSDTQERPLLERYPRARIHRMYSGVEDSYIDQSPVFRRQIRSLLYVGALYRSKGLETILQALAGNAVSELTLTVVGQGPDEEWLKSRTKDLGLEERVTFAGQVPHERVFPLMRHADCLMLISRETFGMVYVEAMSQACIPVGAVGEGIDGVVHSGENGFLTPLGDAEALRALMEKLIALPEENIARISERAWRTACDMTDPVLAQGLLESLCHGR